MMIDTATTTTISMNFCRIDQIQATSYKFGHIPANSGRLRAHRRANSNRLGGPVVILVQDRLTSASRYAAFVWLRLGPAESPHPPSGSRRKDDPSIQSQEQEPSVPKLHPPHAFRVLDPMVRSTRGDKNVVEVVALSRSIGRDPSPSKSDSLRSFLSASCGLGEKLLGLTEGIGCGQASDFSIETSLEPVEAVMMRACAGGAAYSHVCRAPIEQLGGKVDHLEEAPAMEVVVDPWVVGTGHDSISMGKVRGSQMRPATADRLDTANETTGLHGAMSLVPGRATHTS